MATKKSNRFRPELENLEGRLLLYGGGLLPALAAYELAPDSPLLPDIRPVLSAEALERLDQSMGLPVYNSYPGAPVTLHLDFTGSIGEAGFIDEVAPFDIDGHPSSFSDAEKAMILEVWQRVSEDFAPFNINVTTAYYGPLEERTLTPGPDNSLTGAEIDLHHGVALTVYMNRKAPGPGSGDSDTGSFSNQYENQVFAYSKEHWEWSAQGTLYDFEDVLADTASHEAGHAFGLQHHSDFGPDGGLIAEYSPGTDIWSPIMGDPYDDDRTTWSMATVSFSSGRLVYQDELAVITRAENGFGYRPDDHGNTRATASTFSDSPTGEVSAAGIIERMSDADVFRFNTGAGNIRLRVNVAEVGPNLDTKIELRDSRGRLVAQADPDNDLGATIERRVSAGTYYLHVMSHGVYGDLGQYTVQGALNVPKVAVKTAASRISETTLNILGPSLGETRIDKPASIIVPVLPPAPPALPAQPNVVSVTSARGASTRPANTKVTAMPAAKTSTADATERAKITAKKASVSTSAIDRVFARGLDKLAKLF